MKQHNAATSDGRNCWGSARERERMRARFNIRQRVNSNNNNGSTITDLSVPNYEPSTSGSTEKVPFFDDQIISRYLTYIRKGDRSKFSTTFLDRHFALISATHSIQKHILENPDIKEETLKVATKEKSHSYSVRLLVHMESLSTFTFTEYAVWLGKYSIVSGMLHGGINPCVRGRYRNLRANTLHKNGRNRGSDDRNFCVEENEPTLVATHLKDEPQKELEAIGSTVLKRFFHSFPLRLSSYIVSRAVEMRMIGAASDLVTSSDEENNQPNAIVVESISERMKTSRPFMMNGIGGTFFCPLCCQTRSIDIRLCYRSNNSDQSCNHVYCELCFWNDMLSEIDSPARREAKDVIICLMCKEHSTNTTNISHTTSFLHQDISDLSRQEKRQLSIDRFNHLPTNPKELKRLNGKKKKATEADHISSNWLDAVLPSLGSTQDVRMDKFMVHVERNAITYVKGCLLAGVDVDRTNEYGQSALFIAAWRGYYELVRLLLNHGADITIPANGGSQITNVISSSTNRLRKNIQSVLELVREFNEGSVAFTLKDEITSSAKNDATRSGTTRLQKISSFMDCDTKVNCFEGVLKPVECFRFTRLIPSSSDHPGAGSCFIDNAITSGAADTLLNLFHTLPIDTNQKQKKNAAPCSERSYYCDTEGYLRQLLGAIIVQAGVASKAVPTEFDLEAEDEVIQSVSSAESSSSVVRIFPHMRFLHYSRSGTVLAPHIDLCRVNPFCNPSDKQNPIHRSTHTFILYLTDCHCGGETSLLEEVTPDCSAASLAKISPRKGRLLIFPHLTPHEGMEVIDAPKILLRGELQIR